MRCCGIAQLPRSRQSNQAWRHKCEFDCSFNWYPHNKERDWQETIQFQFSKLNLVSGLAEVHATHEKGIMRRMQEEMSKWVNWHRCRLEPSRKLLHWRLLFRGRLASDCDEEVFRFSRSLRSTCRLCNRVQRTSHCCIVELLPSAVS